MNEDQSPANRAQCPEHGSSGDTVEQSPGPGVPTNVDETVIRFTLAETYKSKDGWELEELPLGELEQKLATHFELEAKGKAPAWLPGTLDGNRRIKPEVATFSGMVFDLDGSQDLPDIEAKIEKSGLRALIYTTHSHGEHLDFTSLEKLGLPVGATRDDITAALRAYVANQKKYTQRVVDSVQVVDLVDDEVVYIHEAVDRARVVLWLREEFKRSDWGDQFEEAWRQKYGAVGAHPGLAYDPACMDLARAFLCHSAKPFAPRYSKVIPGRLLDLNDFPIELDKGLEAPDAMAAQRQRPSAMFPQGGEDDLRAWHRKYGKSFKIEVALRKTAPITIFRQPRAGGGTHIECPFEATHSSQGGNGTFVVDPNGVSQRNFGLHCCHKRCLTERGDGRRVDQPVFSAKMLERGWLTRQQLQDPALGGGPIPSTRDRDLLVNDVHGAGLDCEVFCKRVLSVNGVFDFESFTNATKFKLDAQTQPHVLADLIEDKGLSIAVLCLHAQVLDLEVGADQMLRHIAAIAKRKVYGGGVVDLDAELDAVAQKFSADKKGLAQSLDLQVARLNASEFRAKLGVLSEVEAALVKPVRDLVSEFSIIKIGGSVSLFCHSAQTLAEAVMSPPDFKLLQRPKWIQVSGETLYPGDKFLAKPPRNTRVYPDGVVFDPSGRQYSTKLNIYPGFRLRPDPSGSCAMFYDLLEEVWAQFRVDVFLYVREWLMHILAHPEAKVPSSLAIRGEQGDGKSLVFERCMARILGPLMLVVANHNLVLGNYNEAVMGKLLIVLEEATFAGDKAAFDNMKQVITGEQITVNPKYKSPITVDNYARVVVVSNHLHFLQREAADRRYTVIETVGAWQGTSKFEQLVDQWNNGGAERFLYEALNHDFRKLDGGDRLVISRNIPTEAGIRQVAHSRTLVQRFVVEWLLGGNIGGKYSSDQKRFPAWDLDAECEVPSKHIESNLREWLKENEHHGSQRAVPLSAIMIEVERYFGETRGKRSKTQADVMTGKRANSPTMRVLPPRRAAIENARAQGLITQEEYDAALPAPGDEQDTSGQ